MDGGTGPGAQLLQSPAEAEWPPELRLPPPPPSMPAPRPEVEPSPSPHRPRPQLQTEEPHPPLPRQAEGFDGQNFVGSIMGAAAQHQQPVAAAVEAPVKRKRGRPPKNRDGAAPDFIGPIMAAATQQQQPVAAVQHQQPAAAAAEAPVKRKRGRPPKNRDGAAPAPAKAPLKKKDEEIVCFICFDGGNLVVCDRRGCPKVYHPACIKRDESFFRAKAKWDCGWHICSICEKAAHYMCYTCTYSLCKGCVSQGDFFGVRGSKGFCDACYGTILLIESKDDGGSKIRVDFDDQNSWEYLFKLYWLDVKGKHLLTSEELIGAKSHWNIPTIAGRREKEESSDESYDANNEQDASFDISSKKRRQVNSSGKRGRKRQKNVGVAAMKREISVKSYESLPNRLPIKGVDLQGGSKWASPELLDFIGHMRNGDSSCISQYDVEVLLLEYIKQNNLRDPCKKSQIICDARLNSLFRKPRVAHFEMLKLLEMHFDVKDNPTINADSHPDSAQLGSDNKRKIHKKIERELTINPEDYAAIDMHNINLIYLRRSLMEDLIDDNAAFSDKIAGAFVRIRICGLGQKQDMYRLVKVLGTHKVAERYSTGKKTTDYALEILNLDKKEVITIDTISNQDFTEEECMRLRQSMKFGLVTQLKVGDIYEKAKIFQSLQFNDWLENEKQRLSHLCDRASETGRRKELRECVEKLHRLNNPEERARKINEVPEVHVDPCMAPDYESAEEQYYKKAADWTLNGGGSNLLFPERKVTKANPVENHTKKSLNASGHMSSPSIEDMSCRSGAVINLNNTAIETASLLSSGAILSDTEPEKVWHYKDPSGNIQGPFTLLQLSNWASYFPHDLRIWLTFESEKNSFLLSEVLRKQQKDFVLPSAVTTDDKLIRICTEKDRTISDLVANNSSSPTGYNPTKEGPTVLCETLASRSLKDSQNFHEQVHHQINYSRAIPSSTTPGSHDERVPREKIGEWEHCQDTGGMWSPTVLPMNNSFKSNVEPHTHPDGYTMKDQLQNDSNDILPVGSVESLNSQIDSGLRKVSVLTLQQSDRDSAASRTTKCPSEFICKEEDTCWRSSTNGNIHDNLQLSIALAKPDVCSPINPVEERDLSSASSVPNQLGVPVCLPHQVPSVPATSSSKTVTIKQHNKSLTDASSKPFDQHPEHKNDAIFSSNTHQDSEFEYPSPTPKWERKQTSMNQSGSTSVIPKDSGTNTCVNSSTCLSESSRMPAAKTCSMQSLNQTSCLEEKHLSNRDTTAQKEQLNEHKMAVKRENIMGKPILDAEGKAVSDVLESLTEKNCEKNNDLGAESLEILAPTSPEEEQPQCSSPIALSPWGEQNYYQGEAVDSVLWGVQDDPSNGMWLHSPRPALLVSSGADGEDASHIIDEVMAARESNTFVETLLKQGEKKMEQRNPITSAGSGALEKVRGKPSAVPDTSLDGSTKTADRQSSGTSREGSAKAFGWKPLGLSLEGITKDLDWQPSGLSLKGDLEGPSDISIVGGAKASSRQPSDTSLGGAAKASGFQQSSASPEGSRKASGWQRSGSYAQGNTKASGRQPSGSGERSAKADGWQTKSSSLEEIRKGSCWHSSWVNSMSGASETHKSSSGHQATTPTAKDSREAPRRLENSEKNSVCWGEALGNYRNWHPSSGIGSRGSQGGHNHDRYSHGSEGHNHDRFNSRRGSSNHSSSDYRQDHGRGGSSRSFPRGQWSRGVCKYYEKGHCFKGAKCHYLHR